MIAHLSGKCIRKTDRALILDVNGVGYLVSTPAPLLEKAELHLPLNLHIHTVVREDDLSLYGFETLEDLTLFQLLISVSGVGPRLGMDLFTTSINTIKKAIFEKNILALTQMKGIGKKTAERIILELKDKIGNLSYDETNVSTTTGETIPDDVLHALLGLGYHRRDITRIFRSLQEPTTTSEELIKYFLKNV